MGNISWFKDPEPTDTTLFGNHYTSAKAAAKALVDSALDLAGEVIGGGGEISVGTPTDPEKPPDWDFEDFILDPAPDTTMTVYPAPPEPIIDDITIDPISGIPSFDIPTMVITLPVQPNAVDIPELGEPDPITNAELPATPVYDLPALPVFAAVSIPDSPALDIIPFDGTKPTDDIIAPVNNFSFSEAMYNSDLLEALRTKLINDVVNGGTGLGADVEDAIWSRNEERDKLALQEGKDRVSDEWATRGFPLPDGVLTTQLQELEKQYNDARLTASKDISIKQAELALQNTHFIIEKAVALEGQLMTYTSQMCQRSLDAAKASVEMSIAIFNASVARYQAHLEAYKVEASVYEIRIRAALARAEIYKTQIEAAKLTVDMNMALIELYKAQLAGIDALIKCYVASMEGAKVKTDIERLKLEAFKAKVEGYQALINCNLVQFQAYDSAIKGEVAKAQLYGEQVQAYKARVEASKIEADIATEEAKVMSEVQKNKVLSYSATVDAFKAKVESEKVRIEGLVEGYKGEVEGFKAETQAEAARVQALVATYDSVVRKYAADVQYHVGSASAHAQVASANIQAAAHASVGAAQCAAQVAAAAISVVHLSQSTQQSESASWNYGHAESEQWQHSDSVGAYTYHNYNYHR